MLMVPVDDSVTMTIDGMAEIVKRLRSSIVLPMHRLGTPLSDFVSRVRGQFEVDQTAGSFLLGLARDAAEGADSGDPQRGVGLPSYSASS